MAIDITARVTRSNGWWAISVPEIPGLFTQAKRLDQVERMVLDAASLLNKDVSHVEVVPVLDEDAQIMLRELGETRAKAEALQKESSDMTKRAIRLFQAEGLTLRDIASLIGLSPQRVSVIAREG